MKKVVYDDGYCQLLLNESGMDPGQEGSRGLNISKNECGKKARNTSTKLDEL